MILYQTFSSIWYHRPFMKIYISIHPTFGIWINPTPKNKLTPNFRLSPWGNLRYQTTTEGQNLENRFFFSFCTKSIQITFIDFRMVPGGLLGLRESRRAPRCIILWFWALLKNQVFGPKMLTLPNRLKICFSKAERNQFSDFNMNYHVKPRQFQAHMDQFWRSVGQIFDLRSRSQNRKKRKIFFSDSSK